MIRMTEEQRAEFLRSTSMDIALMRTRFDEIDEQKIYEKGLRLGKKIGKIIGERSAELLLLSEQYEMIKTSEDLAEQVHQIVNQRAHR